MSFANPYFLLALAGAALPVIIHLLTRDRVQHVTFSTLRFFVKGAKLVVRRKKFQELLLLLMRVLMVALLAFIFARPFLKSKASDNAKTISTARVIVIDTSGSMRRTGLPEAIKREALVSLGSLKDGEDAGALITFADAPSILEPVGNKIAPIKAVAAEVSPGYGGTNIAEALRKANELLRTVPAKQKEIVLISDLQREGWHYFKGDWKLADDVKLIVPPIKSDAAPASLSIVDAKAPESLVLDRQPVSIAARIANYSDQPLNDLDVTLTLNGKKIEIQKINIGANGTASVRFRHVFDTSGDNLGSVTLGAADANAFYFNARTIPRIPVLLVNGRPSPDPQTDAAFFLNKALAPGDESPFDVKVVTARQIAPQDVAAASVVIVSNVGETPAPVADALAALLNRGGGIFFLPGDQVKAETFNAVFGTASPCKLRQVLQARPASGEPAESLTRVDFDHPVFEVFALPHHGDLTLPKFAQYWETTETQLSRVLARFGDGRPAILEREIGKGVAMALVSAIDAKWNDFAYQSVFLPYLHQTIRYLAVRTGQRTGYASGDLLPVSEGSMLKDPDGKTHPAGEALATKPGFYYVLNKDGKQDFCYAVNGSFAEADPATVAADEIVAAIERAPGEVLGALDVDATSKTARGKKDGGLWWYLLCGLVTLTLAELVIGNKTLRH